MRDIIVRGAILAVLMTASQPAFAQDPIHKFGRGVTNVLTCWVELPRNFHQGMQESNPVFGVGWGVVKGSGLTFTRLAVGAYEAVSFLIPYPNAYGSPYEGMELPDYAWE